MRTKGPWKILKTTEPYRDPWVRLERDEVIRPDGQPGSYCVVHIKPGVCVVPMDDDGHVYLTHEYHYAVDAETIEGVSGGCEAMEHPIVAAKRELQEELGIEAESWIELGMVDPFTASVLSPTRLFLAQGLSFVDSNPEGTELIRRVRVPFQEAMEMALDGRITHAPSLVLLFRIDHYLKQ